MREVVETSSQHINGKPERIGRFEIVPDRELHQQFDIQGPDERAHV
jgi:hypothetical protein